MGMGGRNGLEIAKGEVGSGKVGSGVQIGYLPSKERGTSGYLG